MSFGRQLEPFIGWILRAEINPGYTRCPVLQLNKFKLTYVFYVWACCPDVAEGVVYHQKEAELVELLLDEYTRYRDHFL